jgi:hypothetical protein
MAQSETQVRSYREAIRWGLLIASIAVTGFRLPQVFRDVREWRRALPIDPSAADLYRTELMVSVIGIAVVLCVGVGAFYLLRSPAKDRR